MKPNWFIALPVPAGPWYEATLDATPLPPRVRTFSPDDLHLTVAFLGSVEEEAAHRAFALHTLWQEGPLSATLGNLEPMGPPRRFSALSVLLNDGRQLVEQGMQACCNPMRLAAGIKPEKRAALAHMTVARPQRRASASEREAALEWGRALRFRDIGITLSEMALYTWSQDRKTSLFRIAERVAL